MTDLDTLPQIPYDPDYISAEDFDEDAYDSSLGNRLKQGWICLQATMMTIYMIIGVRNYNKLIPGWSKVKSLFVFQTVIIAYLVVNEFTHRHISGIYLVLLFTQYSLFLTFCLVVDSMITSEQDANINDSKLRIFNKVFRICMHLITLGLFISTFFMKDCHSEIYPINFIAVVSIVLIHQVYDVFLYFHDYMIDYDNLPFISKNKLNYNKELFKKQTKCLMIGNLVFGVISIFTVAGGYFIMNRQSMPGARQHLLCLHGFEWIYLSPVGNIFGTLHQLLILMQINITQYVLVRIPRNMGLFDSKKVDLHHALGGNLRSMLLDKGTSINDEGEETTSFTDADGKISLGKLLQKIKESQKNKDDNFRA